MLLPCFTLIGVYFDIIILDELLFWRTFAHSIIDFFSLKGPKCNGTLYIRDLTLLLKILNCNQRRNLIFKIAF